MSDLECYCSYCGTEHTESKLEKICPTCGADTEEWTPIYYECQHGVRYEDRDSDYSWQGKDRECACG